MSVANAESSLPFCWIIRKGVRALKRTDRAHRAQALRDLLGAPTALDDDDDRDFNQQMKDLGVEVVSPVEPVWYEPDMRRSGKSGIKDKISVTKSGITIGAVALQTIGAKEGTRIKIGVAETQKTISLVIKHHKDGLKIVKSKANSHKVGTKKLSEWLLAKGIKPGLYRLEEIKGGWLAVPV